jgi:hypothetical protein
MHDQRMDGDAKISFFRDKAAEFRRLAKQADGYDQWSIAERLLHAAADLEAHAWEIEIKGRRA